MNKKKYPIQKPESEWRKELTDKQYHILREKGTEHPFTGKLNMHFEAGSYTCGACNTPLFESENKFNSGCGWPSFDNAIKNQVTFLLDKNLGMISTEIVCSNCGSHLGHVFNDGPTETGQRYCVNSLSIDFQKNDN